MLPRISDEIQTDLKDKIQLLFPSYSPAMYEYIYGFLEIGFYYPNDFYGLTCDKIDEFLERIERIKSTHKLKTDDELEPYIALAFRIYNLLNNEVRSHADAKRDASKANPVFYLKKFKPKYVFLQILRIMSETISYDSNDVPKGSLVEDVKEEPKEVKQDSAEKTSESAEVTLAKEVAVDIPSRIVQAHEEFFIYALINLNHYLATVQDNLRVDNLKGYWSGIITMQHLMLDDNPVNYDDLTKIIFNIKKTQLVALTTTITLQKDFNYFLRLSTEDDVIFQAMKKALNDAMTGNNGFPKVTGKYQKQQPAPLLLVMEHKQEINLELEKQKKEIEEQALVGLIIVEPNPKLHILEDALFFAIENAQEMIGQILKAIDETRRLLKRHGVPDIDIRPSLDVYDENGDTPLIVVLQKLANVKADIIKKSQEVKSSNEEVAEFNQDSLERLEEEYVYLNDVVLELLNFGANPNLTNDKAVYPIVLTDEISPYLVKLFMEKKADTGPLIAFCINPVRKVEHKIEELIQNKDKWTKQRAQLEKKVPKHVALISTLKKRIEDAENRIKNLKKETRKNYYPQSTFIMDLIVQCPSTFNDIAGLKLLLNYLDPKVDSRVADYRKIVDRLLVQQKSHINTKAGHLFFARLKKDFPEWYPDLVADAKSEVRFK